MKNAAEYLFAAQAAAMAYQEETVAAANPVLKDIDGQLRVYTDSAPTMTASAYGWVKGNTFFLTFRGTQSRSDMLADARILRTYLFPGDDKSMPAFSPITSRWKRRLSQILS